MSELHPRHHYIASLYHALTLLRTHGRCVYATQATMRFTRQARIAGIADFSHVCIHEHHVTTRTTTSTSTPFRTLVPDSYTPTPSSKCPSPSNHNPNIPHTGVAGAKRWRIISVTAEKCFASSSGCGRCTRFDGVLTGLAFSLFSTLSSLLSFVRSLFRLSFALSLTPSPSLFLSSSFFLALFSTALPSCCASQGSTRHSVTTQATSWLY